MLDLREAVNVDDLKEREKLLARLGWLRIEVQLNLNTIVYWNRTHPDETPIGTEFERAILDFIDGKGPMPTLPESAASQ